MKKDEVKVGDVIGKWTVIGIEDLHKPMRQVKLHLRCECGKEVVRSGRILHEGESRACSSCAKKADYDTKAPEYRVWMEMKNRCYYEKHISYPDYGGRGIIVCDEWRESYEVFLKDVGPRPSSKHSLDRIDNNSGYFPNNVKWSTDVQQSRNRRSNVIIEYNGQKRCISEWEEILGFPRCGIQRRLWRGWTVQDALGIPHQPKRKTKYKS